MKTYKASVIDNGELKHITDEYKNKEAFARDLRANGYIVRFIGTPETWDQDIAKYELNKEVKNKLKREGYR